MRITGVANYVKVLIDNLDKNKYCVNHFTQGRSPKKWRNIFLPFIIIFQLLKFKYILKKDRPDIVHLNSGMGQTNLKRDLVYLKFSKSMNVPVLFFFHGWKEYVFNRIKKNHRRRKFFINRILLADAVVVSANQFKKELIDLGIESQKIFVSSSMVESKKYHQKIKKFDLPPYEILFCSSMIKPKGIYELLDSIPFVIQEYPGTIFTFIGNGIELYNLKEKSKELQIENNVEFTGYISNTEKIRLFKKAHVFVLPSHTEGFPTVVLEAMAAGIPLVVTPVGGLIDVILEGVNGEIIKSMPPRPKEIGEKIIKLISNPNLMKKMNENNKKMVIEKYDAKVISFHLGQIYEKISKRG